METTTRLILPEVIEALATNPQELVELTEELHPADLADLAADGIAQARAFAIRAQHEDPVHTAVDLVLDQPGHPGPVEALVGVERRHGWWDDSIEASLAHC